MRQEPAHKPNTSIGLSVGTQAAFKALQFERSNTEIERLERGQAYLNERDILLRTIAPDFINAANTISAIYSHHALMSEVQPERITQHNDGRYRDLPSGTTRYTYIGLLHTLSQKPGKWNLADIWNNCHNEPTQSTFQLFGWSFNRMKFMPENDGLNNCGIKSRGSIDQQTLPYTMHTHVEVPYGMRFFGLGDSVLSLAGAATHDVAEEGGQLDYGQITDIIDVDLSVLSKKYTENNLGACLQILIPGLTETEYAPLVESLKQSGWEQKFNAYNTHCREIYQPLSTRTSAHALEKSFERDPLVFGGLALQIEILGEYLQQASYQENSPLLAEQIQQLLLSLVEVEFADRLSDTSTFERYLSKTEHGELDGRHKVLAVTSRMINMYDKLNGIVEQLDPHQQDKFKDILTHFPYVLAAKLMHVNELLQNQGLSIITADEWCSFHQNFFVPVQVAGEELIKGFISNKVDKLVMDSTN